MTTYVVSSGVTSSGLTLGAGDVVSVQSGGVTEKLIVSSGGSVIVSSGGLSVDDTLSSGGTISLMSGAVGSSMTVFSGGLASGGGTLSGSATDDGVVSGLQVGGVLTVGSGGVTQAVSVLSGGSALISSGGVDSGAVVLSGGVEVVAQGGSAVDLNLRSGAMLTDDGTVTFSGAAAETLAGQITGSGILVQNGAGPLVISATAGAQQVSVDVTVSGTQGPWSPSKNPSLNYGGDPTGGEASVTGPLSFAAGQQITVTYLSGTVGTEAGDPQFDAGGNPSFTAEGNGYPGQFIPGDDRPVYHGELLGAFADADGKVVGSPFVLGDGPTTVTVPSGATQLLMGVNDNGYSDNNGSLKIEVTESGSSGATPSLVISGGVAQLAVAGALGVAPVVFAPGAGSSATLEIAAADLPANGGSLANPLSNFDAAADALDLRGLAYVSGATAVASGGVLTVTDGSQVLSFTLEGAIFPSFVASSDGDGGLIVREQPALTVSASVVSSGLSVGTGDQLTVLSGGEIEDCTVLSGGSATVSSGALGSAVTVSSGGQLSGPGKLLGSSFDAGEVSGVSVGSEGASAGYLEIRSGGSTSATEIADGELKVDAGGSATGTVLSGLDTENLVFGAASGTVVGSGGQEVIGVGGVASGATVSSGGEEVVSSGGLASATTVLSGGKAYVFRDGVASGTTLSGGKESISSVGRGVDLTVSSGGADYVLVGGTTTGTQVSAGGREVVSSGGVASATTVLSGGLEYVFSGGVGSGDTVGSGGTLVLESGGTASAALVDDAEVRAAGGGTLGGTLEGNGAIVQAGAGTLLLSATGADYGGKLAIEGGTVELATSGAIGSGYVEFVEPATGSAVLQIDAADAPAAGGTFANTIVNFDGAGEDIDLRSIAFVSGASAAVVGSTLVLTDGGATYTFKLAGGVSGLYPVLSDGHGGTLIDPKALAFTQTAAAFAPSASTRTALIASAGPNCLTPFAYSIGSGGVVHT